MIFFFSVTISVLSFLVRFHASSISLELCYRIGHLRLSVAAVLLLIYYVKLFSFITTFLFGSSNFFPSFSFSHTRYSTTPTILARSALFLYLLTLFSCFIRMGPSVDLIPLLVTLSPKLRYHSHSHLSIQFTQTPPHKYIHVTPCFAWFVLIFFTSHYLDPCP